MRRPAKIIRTITSDLNYEATLFFYSWVFGQRDHSFFPDEQLYPGTPVNPYYL